MIWRGAVLLALAASALAGCATTQAHHYAGQEATPFVESTYPAAELAAARADAVADNRLLLAVFGANWCRDSRVLAGWLETPRFRALTDAHYEIVYLDAGIPQSGEGHNLDLAAELGVSDIIGTPTVLVLGRDGALLNGNTAKGWRNAASRSEDGVFAELESFTRN